MAKSLIITEKPSVAQEFAKILGVSGRNDGYIENGSYVITWCVGHLVEMVYPEEYDIKYKKWKLEDLPFLPKDYKYNVISSVSKQYDVVHRMLHREDIEKVYWAGDAGKEGQTIEENIRRYGGVREGMQELRVWIDSQTEEEIRRGLDQAKPMSEYDALANSGIMRTIEDYAMGINFSRVMSVKYGSLLNDAAGTKSYTAIAVGRVMTCVLGMVVIREREIRNFIEIPFFRVVGSFSDAAIEGEWKAVEGSTYFESPLLYKENGFKKRESAEKLIDDLTGKAATVKSIEKGITKKRAPLLFNLAELQAECSKRFKISPDETLQVAQDLYEKKLTTYPRTDARVLSTAVAKEIGRNISRLKVYPPVASFAENIMKNGLHNNIAKTSYTDDTKVTDHYAIIPTGQMSEYQSLNDLQKKVLDLIARRFISIFYPPAQYQNVKLTINISEESFFASAKTLKEPGFLIVSGKAVEEDKEDKGEDNDKVNDCESLLKLTENMKQGDVISVGGFELKEGKTSPPKRYTSGSMVLAMENAGQLIEEEELREQIKGSGIGTSATRAEIIKKLVRIGYLALNKKTQILTPETLGEMVFEVVNMTVPGLLNPKMTASWEKGLDGITNGTVEMNSYRAKLEEFIRKETISMIDRNLTSEIAGQIRPLAGKNAKGMRARVKLGIKCPLCDGEIETTPFGYGCSNYNKDGSGCHFAIGTIAGRDLEDDEVRQLITDGKTSVLTGFLSKSKKKFDASLVLAKDEEGRTGIQFDFSAVEPELLENLQCPVCGAAIEKTPFGYSCATHHKEPEKCYFSIGKIAGRAISEEELKTLITEGRTAVLKGFTSKNKKKFAGSLVLTKGEDEKYSISFDFSQNEPELVEGVQCPLCGGNIEVKPFGYGCSNFDAANEASCHFAIGKIAGKDLNVTQVKELLSTGKTGTIRGFTSKNKKKFDACLILADDETGKKNIQFDFEHVEAKKIKDVTCPLCGGDIVQTPFGYGCANYNKDVADSCRFSIGKIAGVKLKETQIKTLLLTGKTEPIVGFKSKSGKKFDAPLKLTQDGRIEFDFPENPQTSIACPKCQKMLRKSQWYYECECGFRVSHTIAQVSLSEECAKELFTTGRTKEKVTGFVSKAGNKFDAYLKFTEEGIKFDFEDAASAETEQSAEDKPEETELETIQGKEEQENGTV